MTNPISNRFDAEFTLTGAWLPAVVTEDYFLGVRNPDKHQVKTRAALKDNEQRVILNTNPTGAGKTLSWASPTIRSGENGDGWVVVATYPTNALVDDQMSKLSALMREYYTNPPDTLGDNIQFVSPVDSSPIIQTSDGEFSLDDRVIRITGEDTLGTSTRDEMKRVLDVAFEASTSGLPTIILTTPDMLTIVAKNLISDPDARGLVMGVDAVVVDEFHLANPRAKRHLPFYLDFYQNRLGNRTPLENLVFLSATPDEKYVSQIERGMNTTTVTRKSFAQEPSQQARQILPEATLYTTHNQIFHNGRWLVEHIGEVVEWIESGEEQSLLIVDSVSEVNLLADELRSETALSVGKVYGWKKEGRQAVVESSEIVVGNTAMEVGIDFEKVDRILTTGYTSTSALQRIGRMRARDEVENCEIALITTDSGHDAICSEATNGQLTRQDLDRALQAIGEAADTHYYGLLCALYFQYLWKDASQPIGKTIRKQELPAYKQAVYDHFKQDADAFDAATVSSAALWSDLRALRTSKYSSGTEPLFEEMHSYRSSSLSVTIIDETDSDEPVKEYMLNYILRYGEGKFIQEEEAISTLADSIERSVTERERQQLQARQKRTVGTFRLCGLRDNPVETGIEDFKQVKVWRNRCPTTGSEVNCPPELMSDPDMKRRSGGIEGSEHIDVGDKILAQYAHGDRSTVRSRFSLGPYANIYSISDSEVLILWQDGILAHAQLMNRQVKN